MDPRAEQLAEELGVGDEVPGSEPPRLLREAPEPLEAGPLAPVGRPPPGAGEDLEASADPDHHAGAPLVPLLLQDELLAGDPQAQQEDPGAAPADGAGALGRLSGAEVAVGHATDGQPRMPRRERAGRGLDHRAAGAEQVDAVAMADRPGGQRVD